MYILCLFILIKAIEQPEEASIKYIAKYRDSTCPSDDAATQKRIQEMVRGYFNQAPAVFCFIDNVSNYL